MWIIFNPDGSMSHTISVEPNPVDVVGKTVIETDEEFDFINKQYTLVNGEIVGQDYTPPPPPPVEPPTVQEKLAKAGLTVEELREALGL